MGRRPVYRAHRWEVELSSRGKSVCPFRRSTSPPPGQPRAWLVVQLSPPCATSPSSGALGHDRGRTAIMPKGPMDVGARARITTHSWTPMHPVWRRCSSLTYPDMSPSSRLARRASRLPRADTYSCPDPNCRRATSGLPDSPTHRGGEQTSKRLPLPKLDLTLAGTPYLVASLQPSERA